MGITLSPFLPIAPSFSQILTSILWSISITSFVRILKHGFACSKTCYVDGVENIFQLKNIAFIWSHLLEKDEAITKRRWVLHIFLLTSQWLHIFTTFIISNPSCCKFITLAYSSQIILHNFDGSLTCLHEFLLFITIQTLDKK